MEAYDIYRDMAERTGGDIYIGVVGPVRTGKSTFIKKFMELLVLPNIEDGYCAQRALDELPQCGGGKTIMTTEPKFVPDEGTEITLSEGISFKVRLVDCVGYTVPGALGYEEEQGPRMVVTPWFDHEIPFQRASELGTSKVIKEHSTIGLVMTTDGSITEIPRENYESAEERVVQELKAIGKPFIIGLNSTKPQDEDVQTLALALQEKYGVPVLPMDCLHLTRQDIHRIIQEVLYEFPIHEMNIHLPLWMDELEKDHWLTVEYEKTISNAVAQVLKLRDIQEVVQGLANCQYTQEVYLEGMDLGAGVAQITVGVQDQLYFKILGETSGFAIENELDVFQLIRSLSEAKKEYDYIEEAFQTVQEKGYGIVSPRMDDMIFEEPELFKKGNQFGVKLRASAPSIHMVKVNIGTEVSPVVGTEKQCEELINYLMSEFEKDPDSIWDQGFLGRSLNDLVRDSIKSKLNRLPDTVQDKLQETLQRMINEGSGGLICIIF